MRQISQQKVISLTLQTLGLDPEVYELKSVEAISELIRRYASFYAPIKKTGLIQGVMDSLQGIVDDIEIKEKIELSLEDLIAYGDVREATKVTLRFDPQKDHNLYCSSLSYIEVSSGDLFIVGIPPDNLFSVNEYVSHNIIRKGHIRLIDRMHASSAKKYLDAAGFTNIPEDIWLGFPRVETPIEVLRRFDSLVDRESGSYTLENYDGLKILDTSQPVDYYKGRWKSLSDQTGRYLFRRSQLFGSDIWCYGDIKNGGIEKFIDLPAPIFRYRGFDQAWWIQLAKDASVGNPQIFKIDSRSTASTVRLFSPIPSWGQRKLDIMGARTNDFMTWEIADTDVEHCKKFLMEYFWMLDI